MCALSARDQISIILSNNLSNLTSALVIERIQIGLKFTRRCWDLTRFRVINDRPYDEKARMMS